MPFERGIIEDEGEGFSTKLFEKNMHIGSLRNVPIHKYVLIHEPLRENEDWQHPHEGEPSHSLSM